MYRSPLSGRFLHASLAALLLLVLTAGGAAAQATGTVSGVVRGTDGAPLRGVQVSVQGTGIGTLSSSEGRFILVNVPAGRQTITATSLGYAGVTQQVDVRAGEMTRLEVTLSTRAVELGAITVVGVRQYGSSTSETALKMDAHVMDTPTSVTVITEDFLNDQNATTLDDLFRNVAGITPFSDYQDFTARGFRQGEDEVVYNGMRSNPNNFFSTPNLQNVERVEVLKGPASVLYGSLEGGAMINIVTKSPRATRSRQATVTLGSWEEYGAAVDFTGPIAGNQSFLYRFNANYRDAGSFRDFVHTTDYAINPSLTWRPGERTSLTVKGEFTRSDRQGHRNRGIGAPGGDLFALPVNWTSNEPSDVADQKGNVGEVSIQHQLASGWRGNMAVRYSTSDFTNQYHESLGFATVNGRLVMRRQFRDQHFQWTNFGSNGTINGTVRTGPVEHRLMLAGDLTFKNRLTDPSDFANAVTPLDVYNPQYRHVDPAIYRGLAPDNNPFTRDYRDWGVGVQNLITLIPQVKLLVGTRYNNYHIRNANYRLNTRDDHTRTSQTNRAGVVVQPLRWVSFFGNYSEGFKPQTNAQEERGGPFDPLVTIQQEGGVKFSFFRDRLITSGSTYIIRKQNVLVPDPTPGSPLLVQLGEVQSAGLEFDVVGSILPNWSTTANYANNTVKITEDTRAAQRGARFPNAPRHAAALWTRYDFPSLRLGIGAGASHVGERRTFDTTMLPSYTIYDAAVYYNWNRLGFQLNTKNLTDERYFSGGYNNYQIWPGAPRSVQLTVRANF